MYKRQGYDCAGNCLNGGTSTTISNREVGSFGNYSLVQYGGTWSLTDDQGNLLASDADGDDVTLCLPDGCYDITGNSGSGASYPFGYDINATGTYTVPGAAGTAGGSAQFTVGAGVCTVLGCTDVLAVNYNSAANSDDGTCTYATPSSLISACSDFVAGPSAWPYVLVATTIADGAVSQGAQTFTINVTSLPAGGANVRVYKTTANGNAFFATPVALTLGSNSITVAAVTFDRAVKFQFSSGDVEFDALSLNGVASSCAVSAPPASSLISACGDFVSGASAWPYVLVACLLYTSDAADE